MYDYRALKTRGNTPKYGLIFHSTFIGRAGQKNKGRISRFLANKCSIASRIDCFAGKFNSGSVQRPLARFIQPSEVVGKILVSNKEIGI